MSFSRFIETESQSIDLESITIKTMTQDFLDTINNEKSTTFTEPNPIGYDIKVGDKYLKFNFNEKKLPDKIIFESEEIFGIGKFVLDSSSKISNEHYFFEGFITFGNINDEEKENFLKFLDTGGDYTINFYANTDFNTIIGTKSGTPTTTNNNNSNNDNDKLSLPLIIGVSVGGFVLLAIIVYYFMGKGRRSRGSKKVSNNRMNANRGGSRKAGRGRSK